MDNNKVCAMNDGDVINRLPASRNLSDTPQTLPLFPDMEDGSAADSGGDTPQILPIFPDMEDGSAADSGGDTPQILPIFPDMEGGRPVVPVPIPPIISQTGMMPANRCCRVRFFHAAAQAGPININVGLQRAATNLAFGNFSTYFCYAEGFRTILVMNARNNRTVLLRKTVPFTAGETLTFAVVNNASTGALELVQVNDNACSGLLGGFACIRMVNLLLGNTRLDLLLSDGRLLFSDVRYKESSISRRLRPGSYGFYVANTPMRIEPRIGDVEMDDTDYRISDWYIPGYGELDPIIAFSLRARRGIMYTAYVIGQANIDEVQVIIAENR